MTAGSSRSHVASKLPRMSELMLKSPHHQTVQQETDYPILESFAVTPAQNLLSRPFSEDIN